MLPKFSKRQLLELSSDEDDSERVSSNIYSNTPSMKKIQSRNKPEKKIKKVGRPKIPTKSNIYTY